MGLCVYFISGLPGLGSGFMSRFPSTYLASHFIFVLTSPQPRVTAYARMLVFRLDRSRFALSGEFYRRFRLPFHQIGLIIYCCT